MFPLQSPQEVWSKRRNPQMETAMTLKTHFFQIWKEKEITDLSLSYLGTEDCSAISVCVWFSWRWSARNEYTWLRHSQLPHIVFWDRVGCAFYIANISSVTGIKYYPTLTLSPFKCQVHRQAYCDCWSCLSPDRVWWTVSHASAQVCVVSSGSG